jgi:hypothetical protein
MLCPNIIVLTTFCTFEYLIPNQHFSLQKDNDEEELALLRLISKCIEDDKLRPSDISSFAVAERITLLEERVGQPRQALAGTKRRRTTKEDNVERMRCGT